MRVSLLGRVRLVMAISLLSIGALSSCQNGGSESANNESEEEVTLGAGEGTTKKVSLGPVQATLVVTPKEPLIGDLMTLTLEVHAQKGVRVEMPGKAEAFSRFTVEKYSEDRDETSSQLQYTQRYILQASRSGRLRIPPLRIAFVDGRAQSTESGEQELLTEEIPIKVIPVLAGEKASDAEMRPIRPHLEEELGPNPIVQYWWVGVLVITGLGILVGLFFIRRNKKVNRISPYEQANVALATLEAEGLPDTEGLDDWYVRLSGIVREYLEGRFALRAPELTTEEFLRAAQRSDRLSEEHKALVGGLLEDCDRVKFAGYEPSADESRSVLEAARRFLLESREEDVPDSQTTEEAA